MGSTARYGAVERFKNPDATLRGPKGKLLCRVCGTEVAGRRITFCGDHCVQVWSISRSPGFARKLVRRRDKGICALCGEDCIRLRNQLARMDSARRRLVARVLGLRRYRKGQTLWEMDHIIPVVEGGGSCGLENLRTLCRWCHLGETRKLRRRLAERRRAIAPSPELTPTVETDKL